MDQQALDAILKLNVVMTKVAHAIGQLLEEIKKTPLKSEVAVPLPLNFDSDVIKKQTVAMISLAKSLDRYVDSTKPVEPDPAKPQPKPIPDRHDRANLDFAVRYGHHEEAARLREKFNWYAKPAKEH